MWRVRLRTLRQRLLPRGLRLLLGGGVGLRTLRLLRSARLGGALLALRALLLGGLLAGGLRLLALPLEIVATLLDCLPAIGLCLLPLLRHRLVAGGLGLLARDVALVFGLLALRLRPLAGGLALLADRLLAGCDGLLTLHLGLLLRLPALIETCALLIVALAGGLLFGEALLLGVLLGGVLPLLLDDDGLLLPCVLLLLELRVARECGIALLVDARLLAEGGLLRVKLWWRIATALLLSAIEALRGLRAPIAFGGELGGGFGIVAGAIGAPLRIVLARAVPSGALAGDLLAAFGPLRGDDTAPFALARRHIQGARAGIIARGIVRALLRLGGGKRAAILIDRHDPSVGIAVTVIGIAHEIRCVVAGLVVIIAVAVIDRLGIGAIAARQFPAIGLDAAVIIERIVGRCVADRVADPVGAVDPGIGVRPRRRRVRDPPCQRQRGGGGGGADRRGWAADERLDLRQRGQRRVVADRDGGVAGRGLLVLGGLLAARGERQRADGDEHGSRSKHRSCSFEGRNGLATSHNASERDLASSFMPRLGRARFARRVFWT